MAIRADHSTLPRPASLRSDGCPPDADPRFVQLLVEQWAVEDEAAGSKPRAFTEARFRHSDAGACSRSIAFSALNLPASNPMDLSGTWNTRLGTLIHEAWQEALQGRFPDALVEPKMRTIGDQGAGHADAFLVHDDTKILFELKSVGGFAYKMAVGERGVAQGPKHEHRVQSALNARGLDADEVVIGYLSKEAVSVAVAARKGFDEIARFAAEWTFTRDEWEPLADAEEARIERILGLLDDGQLPARKIPSPEIPAKAVIVDPSSGRWEVHESGHMTDTGTAWNCGYCRYQTLCTQTPAGRCDVDVVPVEIRAQVAS